MNSGCHTTIDEKILKSRFKGILQQLLKPNKDLPNVFLLWSGK